jgi:serine/threonine kinase 32
MRGGDLRFHLDEKKGFSEPVVRIMGAELASALSYLHRKNIVHRDLKPDNILMDDLGHVHISDFNIAVQIQEGETLKSRSGTLSYIAPEVLKKESGGYSTYVDYWSLGVVLYELLYGRNPFNAGSEKESIKRILNYDIKFHHRSLSDSSITMALSKHCRNFISGCLEQNPEHRIGGPSYNDSFIKCHPWFKNIDWDILEAKKFQPLFVPEVRIIDVFYFYFN